jgi:FkbM family methyltransferase
MIQALYHGWREGLEAAALADDWASVLQLRTDYFFSRLLKLSWWMGCDGARQVKIRGMNLFYRFNRGDLQSLREVLVQEVYEAELGFTPATVLDLGANIGLSSLWLHREYADRAWGSCQIIAVEPSVTNALLARLNLESNGVKAEVLQVAAGLVSRQAWFEARTESNLGRMLSQPSPGAVPVTVMGIRELLAKFPQSHVDLVKMDIEGGEAELLGGEANWLDSVRALMVEWHDDRADSRPLIAKVLASGFEHRPLNAGRQNNLSLFVKAATPHA